MVSLSPIFAPVSAVSWRLRAGHQTAERRRWTGRPDRRAPLRHQGAGKFRLAGRMRHHTSAREPDRHAWRPARAAARQRGFPDRRRRIGHAHGPLEQRGRSARLLVVARGGLGLDAAVRASCQQHHGKALRARSARRTIARGRDRADARLPTRSGPCEGRGRFRRVFRHRRDRLLRQDGHPCGQAGRR